MIMSSHAKVTTKILKYLNDCYENGLELDIESLNANRLDISDRQYYQTLNMLSDDGYIKGIEFLDVIANHPIILS
ncbi:YjcQ family protein [Ligilactobacillus salivarius]|uniref:YjcQ family protein n=1 Tax=Ligilactobacillus salivarius TaxID=1624 RepID=UPI002096D75F|nr:YjcQ family protein [Ligilactobacillus salivarius]MCO7134665.1 YjcQ family protein [Ligilactobacillus salivarius]